MKFFETSKLFSLNRLQYINLRWIAIFGQLITINLVKYVFEFDFNYLLTNLIVGFGVLSNFFLIYFYKKNLISDRLSFALLLIDIFQLSFLIYLTGGIINPFCIFIIVPSIFSSIYLGVKTNILLVLITILSIISLTFYHQPLPYPLNNHFHVSNYYYYAVPLSLIIALVFLSYFSISFGRESRIRKEALDKMESIMAKEHELVSLGGQAAAAAHSLGTPLSTIKIILQELNDQFKNQIDVKKDLNMLSSQVDRCIDILKKLSINPSLEDKFLEKDLTLKDYIFQIIKSFEEISKKEFIFNFEQFNNPIIIPKMIEIVYGLRNFIGNANKFSKNKVFINLKSNNSFTEISIEDDGSGFSKEIISKIGEPYINNLIQNKNKNIGLGLGIFIGKTLLEKNLATVSISNSKTRPGAEINIIWKNKNLNSL
tara:strand:+ start:62 stop:1342 length:1281 start_codon:yes stop_codon:yes gene_type:complete